MDRQDNLRSQILPAIDDLEDLAVDRYPTQRLMRQAYELRANPQSAGTATRPCSWVGRVRVTPRHRR